MKEKTPDEMNAEYNKVKDMVHQAIISEEVHTSPSKDTIRMINEIKVSNKELETNQKFMVEEIKEMKQTAEKVQIENVKAHEKIEKAVVDSEDRITKRLKDFEDKIDKVISGKANKWVENLIKAIGSIGLASGMVLLIALLVQSIIHFYRP